MKRSDFLKVVTGVAAATAVVPSLANPFIKASSAKKTHEPLVPVSIATWRFGLQTTAEAMRILSNKGSALDATEAGVKISEAAEESKKD